MFTIVSLYAYRFRNGAALSSGEIASLLGDGGLRPGSLLESDGCVYSVIRMHEAEREKAKRRLRASELARFALVPLDGTDAVCVAVRRRNDGGTWTLRDLAVEDIAL